MLVSTISQEEWSSFRGEQPQIVGRDLDQLLGRLRGQQLPQRPLDRSHLVWRQIKAEDFEENSHRKFEDSAENLFSESVRHCFVELDLDGQDGVDVGGFELRQQFLNFQKDCSFGRVSKELDEDTRIADEVGEL